MNMLLAALAEYSLIFYVLVGLACLVFIWIIFCRFYCPELSPRAVSKVLSATSKTAIVSLFLRLTTLLAILVALASPNIKLPTDNTAVVFAVDRSQSMDSAACEWQENYLRQALANLPSGCSYAIVAFGKNALIDKSLNSGPVNADDGHITSQVDTSATDLAQAIGLSQTLFPPESNKRIVLLTDGQAPLDATLKEVKLAAMQGIEIVWAAPDSATNRNEVILQQMRTPLHAAQNQTFDVALTIQANLATKATVQLNANDTLAANNQVELQPGPNVFLIPQTAAKPGAIRYRAQVLASQDTYSDNNQATALTLVQGARHLLYLCRNPKAPGPFPALMEQQGLAVTSLGPWQLPASVAAYGEYSAIVIGDLDSSMLSQAQQQMLVQAVKQLGLGFAMLGSPHSYAAGEWQNTLVSGLLPVSTEVERAEQALTLALVLVLDKSGSMSGLSDAGDKFSLAAQAAASSAKLLSDQDQLGAVAFDEQANWVLPLKKRENPTKAAKSLATVQTGGGTNLFPALEQAIQALQNSSSALKHIIVLSDGQTPPKDYNPLLATAKKQRITISAVALGEQADGLQLSQLAAATGGRYCLAESADQLPRLFARETQLASRPPIVEKPVSVKSCASHIVTAGIDLSAAPKLRGYCLTSPGPLPAQVILVTENEEIILAVGRSGSAKTLAFTGDGGQKWASTWLDWPQFGPLLAQGMRWIMADPLRESIELSVDLRGSQAQVEAKLASLPNTTPKLTAISPLGKNYTLSAELSGYDTYQAQFSPNESGTWLIAAWSSGKTMPTLAALDVPNAPELCQLGLNRELLRRLNPRADADISQYPELALAPIKQRNSVPVSSWPTLTVFALLLLLSEVAWRRLYWVPSVIYAKLRHRYHSAANSWQELPATAPDTLSQLHVGLNNMRRPSSPICSQPAQTGQNLDSLPKQGQSAPEPVLESQRSWHQKTNVAPTAKAQASATTLELLLAAKKIPPSK